MRKVRDRLCLIVCVVGGRQSGGDGGGRVGGVKLWLSSAGVIIIAGNLCARAHLCACVFLCARVREGVEMSRYEIQPRGHYFLLTRVMGAQKERASTGHTFHYAAPPHAHPSLLTPMHPP